MIESLVCPPPPSDVALNEEAISSLIVPAPGWSECNKFKLLYFEISRTQLVHGLLVFKGFFTLFCSSLLSLLLGGKSQGLGGGKNSLLLVLHCPWP